MSNLLRLIDANLNRSLEGLRVSEDIARFILNDRSLSANFKSLRHKVGGLAKSLDEHVGAHCNVPLHALLKSRDVRTDVGKKTTREESRRRNITDVFRANIQRVKESLRVLEEISKLIDKKISEQFKKIRFRVYELEKKSPIALEACRGTLQCAPTIRHNR